MTPRRAEGSAVAALLLLVALSSLARAQDATPVLPDGWLGEWRGEMTAFVPEGQVQPAEGQ